MKDDDTRSAAPGMDAQAPAETHPAKLRDRLVEQALKRFLPQIEACDAHGEMHVSVDDLAVVLGLLKASLPSQAGAVEAAYDRAIANTERAFRRNKDRSWVLKILREHVAEELGTLARASQDSDRDAKDVPFRSA